MADIFISYSSVDRPRAQQVAQALGEKGFSVWWDRKIPTGEAFDEELETRLDEARAVVVLWSANSVKSKWVKDEASEGLAKKALFPVILEDVRLPFGYRRIQAADFKQWQPGDEHLGFNQLVASLKREFAGQHGALELEGDVQAAAPVRHNWFIDRWRGSIGFRLATLALPAVVMGAGAVAMMSVRVPTHLQLDLTVQRIKFTVGGHASTPIMDALGFTNLIIEKFRSVTLSPKSLRVADVDALESAPDEQKAALWRDVAEPPDFVSFSGADDSLQPSVQIGPLAEDGSAVGKLDLLILEPGSAVTLERRAKHKSLLVKVEGQALKPSAITHGSVRINAIHAASKELAASTALSGLNGAQSLVYDARLRESSPEIKINSADKGLTLKVALLGDTELELMPKGGTLIREVGLIDMSAVDKWESTLIEDGKLSYPDRTGIAPVIIAKSDLLGLSGLSQFAITQLSLDPKGEGLHVRLDGKARQVTVRAGEFARDARLSVLDIYRSSANAAFIVTLVMGVISATWGLFMALRELRA